MNRDNILEKIINELNKNLAVDITHIKDEIDKNEISDTQYVNYYDKDEHINIRIIGVSKDVSELYKNNDNSFLRYFLSKIVSDSNIKDENEFDENLRYYAKTFINSIAKKCIGEKTNISTFFKSLNLISTTTYENMNAKGKILICNSNVMNNNTKFIFKFNRPIQLSETKLARKVLEISNENTYLISNGFEIFGIGKIDDIRNIDKMGMIVITFIGKNYYKLNKIDFRKKINPENDTIHYDIVEKYIMSVYNELPYLNETEYSENKLITMLKKVFHYKEDDNRIGKIKNIVDNAIKQKKGAMVVITDKANEEMDKLEDYSMRIQPVEINGKYFANITAIDGAVMIDIDGKCYGIGVILDGIAEKSKGRTDRGARYNSAVKYIEKCNKHNINVIVVVISEDGMIDILAKDSENKSEKMLYEQILEIKTLYLKGNYEHAIKCSEKIVKENPEYATAYYNRGFLYKTIGKLEEAEKDYTRAIELNPEDATAYYNRGVLYKTMGKLEEAEKDYTKAIELNPECGK